MDYVIRAGNETVAIALMNAGNYVAAEARLRTALAADAQDARALALLARCRTMLDDDKGALEIIRSAAAIDPDDWLVRQTLAHVLLRNQLFEEAHRVASDLAKADPEDSGALFKLAIAHMGQNDMVGAHQLFDQAEANAHDDIVTLINLALLRARQWRWKDADALARRALTIDPTHSEIFFVLAECALAAKQPEEAFDLALEALRLAPADKPTLRLLVRAKARRQALLKPFLPCVDWIVEMDRNGLIGLPVIGAIVVVAFGLSLNYDLSRLAAGRSPVVIFSAALAIVLLFGGVAYAIALSARLGIRRDLRRVALPNF
ncbi:MAG: tetratricopeptide repeat protein [Alphaproteobacteria bacterium]